ncbi:MFS transporter [Stutzerimonas stutzeri]|jgi:DHA1 family bicyclomycin/chloramphenicol resistance-like MFS transporter|uniref:MFS transporter n=1 Tax=Stutzerimonas stutzeri TaxID=316 RepID=A0ABD4XZD5_STUST|nr:MFS transporter [Stutzerimonas stutzeri]EPL64372.1 major facilitator superfamily protein [Stutzerimonas stutzeri B1SMN1]MDH0101519.1 MFS transporter [Stutzerimonas stutzeri]MDH0688061.1 MFS transporter [Stutzerimonas stutzeri]CAB5533476.1 Inner membrane transport protein ydhC [Stutzerimonas stutzeri]CAB5578102.1 Inner membrane transport protein ydhC [Stutzerimonas stutzeri]
MSPRLLTFMVAFAAFLGPFTQTVYAPILPELGGALRTTPFLINLSISIFTLVLAFMQIIYGPLVDRSGRKRTLLAGLAIYIVASLGCFLADCIETLLAFRALQAVGIAAGAVVAVTVIGDRFEGAARGRAMGSFQMMVALGPVVGPVVGGFVGEHLDFHYVFLLLALVGAAALLSNAIWLRETRPAGEPRAFHPAQYLEVLGNRQGLAIMLLSFVQYYAFYNYLVFMPRVLDAVYGLSASEKGLVFLPLSVAVVIGSYVGGRLLGHWRPRPMLLVTALLNALSLLLFVAVAPLSLVALVVAVTAFGLFLGLSLPVQTSLLMDLYQHNRATAVGGYNFFRFMGMATGPVLGSWLFQDGNLGLLYGFAAAAFLLAVGNAQLRFRWG